MPTHTCTYIHRHTHLYQSISLLRALLTHLHLQLCACVPGQECTVCVYVCNVCLCVCMYDFLVIMSACMHTYADAHDAAYNRNTYMHAYIRTPIHPYLCFILVILLVACLNMALGPQSLTCLLH